MDQNAATGMVAHRIHICTVAHRRSVESLKYVKAVVETSIATRRIFIFKQKITVLSLTVICVTALNAVKIRVRKW